MVRFERPQDAQLRLLIRKRIAPLHFEDSQIDKLVETLAGASYADAERVCFDVRKSCILRNDRKMKSQDVEDAITRHNYRRSVLQKATASYSPIVDRD